MPSKISDTNLDANTKEFLDVLLNEKDDLIWSPDAAQNSFDLNIIPTTKNSVDIKISHSLIIAEEENWNEDYNSTI